MLRFLGIMSKWLPLTVLASLVSVGALVACAPEDSATADDDITSERQLRGSELGDKTLSLTFDDGPGERTTELAEYLASEGITATFFINGSKAPGRQNHLEAVVRNGHLLGNHTQNHLDLTGLSSSQVIDEVAATDRIINSVQHDRPSIIRAPFGAWNSSVSAAINGTAMSKYVGSVFWDVGGELTDRAAADWACWGKDMSVERCGQLYLQEIRAKRHGVVLMHDIHNRTVDMVKQIVPALKAEGYQFTGLLDVPAISRAVNGVGSCGVWSDHQLHCLNSRNTPMHGEPNNASPVVNTLRTIDSWFTCWTTGELHSGGNTTWYFAQGDDNASYGFVPAAALQTTSDFDADPSAKGLPRCP